MLQTLDKVKGEAFILNKRLYPYIAKLLDIDKYPDVLTEECEIQYPENTCKADVIFDFESFCYSMSVDDNVKPVFVSTIPDDEQIKEISKRVKILSEEKESENEEYEEASTLDEEDKTEKEPPQKPQLEKYANGVGHGWHGLVLPIIREIKLFNEKNPDDEIEIDQIKEKYGTLRFHASGCPDYIEGMISIAEIESEYVCEICGARGKTVKIDGWYSTLCMYHARAKKASGHKYGLASSLYRKFMDSYERNRWQSMHGISIKKMKKKNWFFSIKKIEGIKRTIRLEREEHKTNFYTEKEKKYFKHGIYVQWIENTDKTLHGGYWHVMKLDEIESFGILERETAEKEAAKIIYSNWGKNQHMELVRMVGFEEGQEFPQCATLENFDDYWAFVKNYLVKNNIKMTGAEHQKYGIPLIENNENVYAFILSYAKWGKIMAEAFDPYNQNKSAYLKWAGERPEGETSWVNPDMENW